MRVAGHVAIQAQGHFFGVALVVVDSLVVFVQTHRLDDHVLDPRLDQVSVQAIAKGSRFVATVDGAGQTQLGLNPLFELGRRELLRRLGCAVIQNPHHYDGVGVNVQAQFD